MRILIFSPLALENGRGGEISAIELATGLSKKYHVTLVDSNRMIGKKLMSGHIIAEKIQHLDQYFRIKYLTINILDRNFSIPYPWELLKLYREIKASDIAYTSILNIKNTLIFIFFSLIINKAKYIIGFRKPLQSDKFISLYNLKYRFSILLFTIFKKKFSIHTISGHAKKYLKNFYEPQRINHIIHGVELSNYDESKILDRDESFLKFIYVGYLDDVHKGVGILVDGIRILLENHKNLKVRFEFCGTGPIEQKLSELEKKFPLNVKFHGYISNERIAEFYGRNDVFLFSSRREPFGRVLIEALASKLVVICTKTIGSVEILKGKSFAFFLPELSSFAIESEILKLVNLWEKNPIRFKELQKSAREYALHYFSFSREIEMFNDLITKIKKR